ncbi:unnamed protein product [Arabis nemorensis]|uniref:Uncharacterized protein n=1 Tax=Arabis nemorensis TaxID=586526 RepID=A0A565AXZ8_9BRAS|nr:unnamed protein product [Arabis nemorensis]
MEEVNRISSLANQSGGIKSYLEEFREAGAPVFELEALDVVEITEADFEVTLPRNPEPSVERIMSDAAASLNQYESHMSPQDFAAEVLPRGVSSNRAEVVKDPVTREALA